VFLDGGCERRVRRTGDTDGTITNDAGDDDVRAYGATVTDPDRWTDQRYLRDVQYRDDRNLAARQAIYAYLQPRVDVWSWALDLAGVEGDETVLDVGCGNGRYLRNLRSRGHRGLLVGIDASAGMLQGVLVEERAQPVALGDAQRLPFATASADIVLAMHMLYHVLSPESAVAELRRVTRPGGKVLVLLNAADHLGELRALLLEAGVSRPERLDVERGRALLAPVFDDVEVHRAAGELVVPELMPVHDYVASLIGVEAALSGDGAGGAVAQQRRAALLEAVTAAADEQIRTVGAFRARTAVGCLVCR
jgi:SAM-dependent methyltransferase